MSFSSVGMNKGIDIYIWTRMKVVPDPLAVYVTNLIITTQNTCKDIEPDIHVLCKILYGDEKIYEFNVVTWLRITMSYIKYKEI